MHSIRPETPENFAQFFPDDISFHSLAMPRAISPVEEVRTIFAIGRLLHQLRPDIVHCHSSKAGVWGRWAARWQGIPSVYTPHGYAFLRTDLSPFSRAFYKSAEWLSSLAGNAIIACGNEEYELSRRIAGGKKPVVRILNALSLDELAHIPRHQSDVFSLPGGRSIRVGTCGRLVPQRNPELFSDLALALRESAQWVWIGAAEASPGLSPHVHCTGWLERPRAMALVADLDIYVQTSLWEGLSYAILEAMAFGKPVVATDIPANRAVIEPGVTGFLGSSLEELTVHVRRLIVDDKLRKRMGEAARKYIQERHDATRAFLAYAKLYRSLLACGAGK